VQIKPESFDHDELRQSVIRLWRHRKSLSRGGEDEQSRRLISQCQEDIAQMLGVRSWSKIKQAIDISRQMKKDLKQKDQYPRHKEVITQELAAHFLDWAQAHGADYLFMSDKENITYYFPGETFSSHQATHRNLERHEIHAIMQALSFEADFLEKFHGELDFSRMMSVNQQDSVLWKGSFFQRDDHCSFQFRRRVEPTSTLFGGGVRLPKEKEILLSDKGLIIFIDTSIHGSCSTIKAAVNERLLLKEASPDCLVFHAMSDVVSGPSERKSGRFQPSFSETSHCAPHMLDLMKEKDFIFVVQRCVEGKMLDTAIKMAQTTPVYLGICGSYSDDDIYLQRASNGLVRALDMFKGSDWKQSAAELFSVMNAIVCSVLVGATRVKEYLVFDEALRKRCMEELEKAATPSEMHLFFATQILEQKHGIVDDLIEIGGNISDEAANFALSAERAWKSNIEKVHLQSVTQESGIAAPKAVRI
jgi:hypothetical protein